MEMNKSGLNNIRGLKIILLILGLYTVVIQNSYAADVLSSKTAAIQQIESSFMPKYNILSIESGNMVSFPTYLNVAIDNKWQFVFKSKQALTISKITLTMDNISITNSLNLEIKPNTSAYYFFTDANLKQIIQKSTAGYKFLGVYKQINADDFIEFDIYGYKKLQVTIIWLNSDKSYYQSVTNFMLIYAK